MIARNLFKNLTRMAAIDAISIAALSLIFIIFLTVLHHGLYPTVFSDEWVYSSAARLSPLSESVSPSYLYLLLFKNTNYCGSNFLDCARLINACFFAFALPFIYLISRRVMPRKTAIFIAVISLLGPINSYTAYFMPESLYFFSFWLFAWFVLTALPANAFVLGSGLGFILGMMSLIKMHAIFLIPVIIIFMALMLIFRPGEISLRKAVLTISCMIVVFFIVRWLFGYIIAGPNGLSLLGSKYTYNALSLFSADRLLRTLQLIWIPLIGHLTAMALLFGMPIAAMVTQKNHASISTLSMFTAACLITLLFITIVTTAQIAGWDPYETINRIHMRYYNFLFPLFYIIAAAELSLTTPQTFYWRQWILATTIAIAGFFAMMCLQKQYTISFIDCPELFGFFYDARILKCLTALAIICLVIWPIRKKWAAALYVLCFLPLAIASANYFVNAELRQERMSNSDAYDRAGQFTRQYLGKETSHLAIVGPEQAGLYKTLFYIDNLKTSMSELPNNIPIEFAKIPQDKTWILFIGNYPVHRKTYFKISKGDFTLIKIKP